jgi:hypothetical protein
MVRDGHAERPRLPGAGRTIGRATRLARMLLPLACLGAASLAAGPAPREAHAPQGPLRQADDTQVPITYRTTTANAVGLTFYNNGFFGNNLASREPSFEYPLGTEEDHLVRAGLWVGGVYSDEADLATATPRVTTATVDGYYGSTDTQTESEFAPISETILERSILPNSRYYDPVHAKSEQDLSCVYEADAALSDTLFPPLPVRVTQEILQFSFEPFDAIVLVNFYITNSHEENPIFDLYVGFYAEMASGWKDAYDCWPPSGTCGPGSWFQKKDIAYDDSLRLLSEHHYQAAYANVPSWAGYSLLGVRPGSIAEKRVSFNWWNWDPSGQYPETPDTDPERYTALSNGALDPTGAVEAPNNDPATLVSVGPLGTAAFTDSAGVEHWILEPGDTLTVSFALVGGKPSPEAEPPRSAQKDIEFNAGWAQTAFDLNFNIPVPPPSPVLLVEPSHARLRLWWDEAPLGFIDPKSHTTDFEGFRIYLSELGKTEGFAQLGDFDLVDTFFFDAGLEAITAAESLVVIEGEDTLVYRYRFDIEQVRDGFKYWVAVTSYDTGTPDIASLESGIAQNRAFAIPGLRREETPEGRVIVFPNPYRGDAAWDELLLRDRYIWFAGIPQRCTIRIYNLAGDLIQTIAFNADTYGAQNVRGIYDPDDVWNPAADVPVLSGNMAAWDLTTREDQAIATGLYVFSVENLETGDIERGTFVIMK